MDTNITRIARIIANEGVSVGKFERIIGASKGVISRAIQNGTDIQSKWLSIIVENYPMYNARWLLTGQGEMCSKSSDVNIGSSRVQETQKIYKGENDTQEILLIIQEQIRQKDEQIRRKDEQLERKDIQISHLISLLSSNDSPPHPSNTDIYNIQD